MLQRAAGNAYSWWWASHIRTKQSKWLEQSVQDMEEKVTDTLKIIDNQGDSFAQRAEMYYRKRPELVAFVEEAFKAYRALAERYDKLSKQLQSANRTIATVCPEQVHYHLEEDDDEGGFEMPFPSGDGNQEISATPAGNIPKVPKFPGKDFRSPSMVISRKGPPKRMASSARSAVIPCSGLNKTEALEEIDKLQKEILSLQTEKEFVKGVYVRACEKFWEIENKIVETQKTVYNLQDEFGVGTVIEDDEARALMASTALRSCQETLDKLQKVQANLSEEAQEEYQRLKEAHERFEMLRDEFISKHMNIQEDWMKPDPAKPELTNDEMDAVEEKKQTQDLLREKIKLQLEKNANSSMTVAELADRIDELVDRVATLETSSASQTVLVQRLKSETDELHSNVNKLEDEKEKIIEDADQTKTKLKDLEDELKRVKDLNQTVRKGNNSLQSGFTEVSCNLEHLSERLHDVKPDEEEEEMVWFKKRSPQKDEEEHKDGDSESSKIENKTDTVKLSSIGEEHNSTDDDMHESRAVGTGEEHEQPDWRQMFINGLDDREKILLEEYTSVLRNYKEVRVKLNEVEKKNRETVFELVTEIRGLKNTISMKDKDIQFLHQKLNISDTNPDGSPSTVVTEYKYTPNEGLSRERDESASAANWQDSPTAHQKPFPAFGEESSSSAGNPKHSDVRQGSEEKREVSRAEKPHVLSTLEKKLRADIDDLLEENLEFWLRYSTSVHQIQKFRNSVQDLRGDILKVREKMGKGNSRPISEVRAIYIHFREIQTELTLWLEHNSVLEDELEGRLSSLLNIQDEITSLSSAGNKGDKAELSDYQAAKFQGEILNMKQESKKVAKELRSGLDHVNELKIEVDNIITRLEEEFDLNNQSQIKRSMSKPRIPLRSFLFGVKLKKKSAPKASLFSCVNPNFEREYDDMPPLPELPR